LDNLTHTLFAITLGRTPLGRAGRGTTAALVLASNAPDIDFVATAGGAVNYLRWHRGPTHGPLGIVGLGVATAALVWAGQRLKRRTDESPDAPFPMLVAISMIGVVFHILMDLPTSYGLRILSPFDWHWFAWDWMPIVDIYLLIVLMAGLLFGRSSWC
jgi:inner membrane protein